jgi:hypothetical protein
MEGIAEQPAAIGETQVVRDAGGLTPGERHIDDKQRMKSAVATSRETPAGSIAPKEITDELKLYTRAGTLDQPAEQPALEVQTPEAEGWLKQIMSLPKTARNKVIQVYNGASNAVKLTTFSVIIAGAELACGGAPVSPTPTSTPVVEPIPSATPAPEVTIVPTPPATPIETASPTTTVNPEITAKPDTALDNNIKKWQNGEKIPNSMLWYGDGTPHLNLEPLNITEPSVATENIATEWIPSIQGEVLGTDEVTSLKGGTNLRLWLGETDGKHQNYVVDVNLSAYGTDYKAAIFINTSKYDALSDYGNPKFVNVKDQEAVFNRLIGNTIIYEVSASPVDSSGVTNPNVNRDEFLASNRISIDYAKFCVAAVKGDYNDALRQYPDVASMILKKGQSRSGQLDAANQPYGGAFKIPISVGL